MFTERSVSADLAEQQIYKELDVLGVIPDISSTGYKYVTPTCILRSSNGEMLTEGFGKGQEQQAFLSAVFESVEHFVSEMKFFERFIEHKSPIKDVRVVELAENKSLLKEKAIRLLCKTDDSQAVTWCREYYEIESKSPLFAPIFLNTPDYLEFTQFKTDKVFANPAYKYSSNSGVAIGSTFEDALLHALLETCERDAYSHLLFAIFFMSTSKIHLVNKRSLPDTIADMIRFIESEYAEELFIFDMTPYVNVPAFCVTFSQQKILLIPPVGCGCSCSKEHALERAILECLQIWHVHTNDYWGVDANIELKTMYNNLSKLKKHQAAMRFDAHEIIKNQQVKPIDFGEIVDWNSLSPKEQLALVKQKLWDKGFEIYYTVEYSSERVVCANVLVPGAERFYLLQVGQPVLPNGLV